MKILMLGWEFPPFYSGGLGVASKNIAEALAHHGEEITFALPFFVFRNVQKDTVKDLEFEIAAHELQKYTLAEIPSSMSSPYHSSESYVTVLEDAGVSSGIHIYGQTLFQEIERYAEEMERYVQEKDFEIIHAHDWITFAAARRIKKYLNIPFIAHVHATEIDRTGQHPNPEIFRREKESLEAADRIIAVSNYTKQILCDFYNIPADKIEVVHNGIEKIPEKYISLLNAQEKKTVLFLGRLTIQKGPDWFLKIAKRVLEYRSDVQFIIGGIGDMLPRILQEIITQNLSRNVFCLGFLDEADREKAFALADVYVMPSVSEPFGLSAVEAAQRGIPVILSHQSGAKEVITHSLSADFWDIDKMANHILAVLEYSPLKNMLSEKAEEEIQGKTWNEQVKKIMEVYQTIQTQLI